MEIIDRRRMLYYSMLLSEQVRYRFRREEEEKRREKQTYLFLTAGVQIALTRHQHQHSNYRGSEERRESRARVSRMKRRKRGKKNQKSLWFFLSLSNTLSFRSFISDVQFDHQGMLIAAGTQSLFFSPFLSLMLCCCS